jgi:CRP/FNR family transcriptional regulator, dissimilatory nitrate respiration regulator
LIQINARGDTAAMPDAAPPPNFRQTALVATLRRCNMFAALPAPDIEAVASGCTIRALQKGEVLFREGEKAEGFYVMQTGAISIYRLTPDGREQIICVFRSPESFAEVTLATTETYPANAVALESSQVIRVQKTHFRELVCRKPELALNMLASMSLHLKHLVQSLQDFKGRQIEGRLAGWLLSQSPAATAGCPAVFDLPISKKILAGQLGVTSETLSRTFARFRDEGLIRVTGPRVAVLDARGLKAYVEA